MCGTGASDSASAHVYRGDGDLSRKEKILLYMREVLNEIRYLNQLEMTR